MLMIKVQRTFILLILLALLGCTPGTPVTDPVGTPTATATLPDPQVFITPAPDVDGAVDSFMDAWRRDDYAQMYDLLSEESRRAVSLEDFTARYTQTAIALTLLFDDGITYQVISRETNPDFASVRLNVNYNTNFFGTLSRELAMSLVREANAGHVAWDEGLIMPDLVGGNVLEIVRQTTPRGEIYASDGSPIAAQEEAVAIGFTPGNLNPDLMSLFYTTMARLTIYQVDEIREMAEAALPFDYVPLGEATRADVDANMGALSSLSGVFLNYYT
jgi:penicillin-binding protein 2